MGDRKLRGHEFEVRQRYRDGERIADIQASYGCSRQAITARLRSLHEPIRDLSQRLVCATCGAPVRRTQARLVSRNVYCNQRCYVGAMKTTDYHAHRQGSRRARAVVWKFFPLPEGAVVHHVDGNQDHNDPANLMVFASGSDHLRWHRGDRSLVTPLWVGVRDA